MNKFFLIIVILISPIKLFSQFEFRGDVFYSYEENITIYLEANHESRKSGDKSNYAFSLLRVYENKENENVEILNKDLETNPEHVSSYKFADNYQINTRKFVILKGLYQFYIFNIRNRKLLGPFTPHFWGIAEDAQSGMITNIQISENGNYIFGSTVDSGGFLYNICNIDNSIEILSANLPFMTTGRFFELKNCDNELYSGIYIIEEYGKLIYTELIKDEKLQPIDNSRLLTLTEEEKEDVIMNATLVQSRYLILDDISSPKLIKYIIVDIFTGNIVNLPKNINFPDKKSIFEFLDK